MPIQLPHPWLPGDFVVDSFEDKAQQNFDALATALDQPGRVQGAVSAAGTVLAGSGFSVTHPATGTYTVTFSRAFNTPPIVVAQIGNSSGFLSQRLGSDPTTTSFGLLIYEGMALTDAIFHFIADGRIT